MLSFVKAHICQGRRREDLRCEAGKTAANCRVRKRERGDTLQNRSLAISAANQLLHSQLLNVNSFFLYPPMDAK